MYRVDRNLGRLSLERQSSSKAKPAVSFLDRGERTENGEGGPWCLWCSGEGGGGGGGGWGGGGGGGGGCERGEGEGVSF